MGWTFGWSRRKDLITERIRNWENTKDYDYTVKSTCLAHCYRGGVRAGVLWTVWEQTFTNPDGTPAKPTVLYIGCDKLEYKRMSPKHFPYSDGDWGYQDMCESMHPFYYSCPLKYLDMVPVACEEWREGVRAYRQRQIEKRHGKQLQSV